MTKYCKRFAESSLDNYLCKTEEQKELVKTLRNGIKDGFDKNIIIIGGVGTGKTHLAYSIINALETVREGQTGYKYYSESKVVYTPVKEIIDEIREEWKTGESMFSFIEKIKKIPLLIVDEIGVQYGSDSERIELYSIFNARYEDCLPTIVISNNSLGELQKILGQRIFDRLTSGALIYQLTGKSFRQYLEGN